MVMVTVLRSPDTPEPWRSTACPSGTDTWPLGVLCLKVMDDEEKLLLADSLADHVDISSDTVGGSAAAPPFSLSARLWGRGANLGTGVGVWGQGGLGTCQHWPQLL